MDIAKIAIFDAPPKITLEDDLLKHIVQSCLVSPVWSSCKAQKHTWLKVIEDAPVCAGGCMVTFVADDCIKIVRIKPV